MNNTIMRTITVTADYQPLASQRLVGSVTISCPPGNAGPVIFKGDDGSEVPWIAGEWHSFRSIDLGAVFVKGTPGDTISIVGGDLVMPYTPIDRTSRAVFSGSLSWQNLPPYATFVVPYAFAHFSETAVPDPVSRGLYNQMIDPRLGTWTAGRFTPARPGRHRLSAQFVIYKQSSQGQLVDVFLQLEVIRSGVITTVGICDALYHLVEGGELALPLQVEATPILQPGDQVQARFGLIEGHLINIVTVDPTRTFFDITAYWS